MLRYGKEEAMNPFCKALFIPLSVAVTLYCPAEAVLENGAPGFSLVVSAPKASYLLGEPVYLVGQLQYNGDRKVEFIWSGAMAVLIGEKDGKLEYFLPKEDTRCPPEQQAQVMSGTYEMGKGDKEISTKVLLHGGLGTLWAEKAGQYQLVCEAWLRIKPEQGKWYPDSREQYERVRSEVLSITVLEPTGEAGRAFKEIRENNLAMLLAPADLSAFECGGAAIQKERAQIAERLIAKYSPTCYADRLRLGLGSAYYSSGDKERIKRADMLFDQVEKKDKEYYSIRLEAMSECARSMRADPEELRRRMDLLALEMPTFETSEAVDYQDVQMERAGYGKVKVKALRLKAEELKK